jgi:hypothetical protein
MEQVSVTVPYNYKALKSAESMFRDLADGLAVEGHGPVDDIVIEGSQEKLELPPQTDTPGASSTAYDDQFIPVPPDPKEIFRGPQLPMREYDTVGQEFMAEDIANGDIELDSAGLPWDARIHSGNKAITADGNWKYKRGVDREVLVPQVEAELRALVGVPSPEPTPPAAQEPSPPTPPATPSASVTTFAQLITGITSNQIPEDQVNTALESVGLTNFALLGARPDLIPTVAGALGL